MATLDIFFPPESLIVPIREEVAPSFPNGGILIQLHSKEYFYSPKYVGASTKEKLGWNIIYNDPFSSPRSMRNQFNTQFDF